MAGEIATDLDGDLVFQRKLSDVLDGLGKDMASGFGRLEKALDGKADKSDLTRIEKRLDDHQQAIGDLQTWRHDREVVTEVHERRDQHWLSRRGKIWATIGAVGLFLATLFGPLIGAHL